MNSQRSLDRGMRLAGVFLSLAAFGIFSGCGYVHFGRLPSAMSTGADGSLAAAYSDLSTEHKILKQELALVRRQGDALRLALERGAASGAVANTSDLATQLAETSRELAALRASNAKLQAERSASVAAAASGNAAQNAEAAERLAVSLRHAMQLEEEIARLRAELERARGENSALAGQLKVAATQHQQTQAALEQLNLELLAEKQERARADQAAIAIRAQLSAVLAQGGSGTVGALSGTPPTTMNASALRLAKAPPAGSSPTAELRTRVERLPVGVPAAPDAPTKKGRTHTVETGDTLDQLARRYYGAPERWPAIYEANSALLSRGQPLQPGMVLQIPE